LFITNEVVTSMLAADSLWL